MASDGAAGEYHGTESVFFEQVAALRLYAEHPAYDGQLLVVCFQNIAAAERVVHHLRRIEMLPQVDVEDLIMSRCAKTEPRKSHSPDSLPLLSVILFRNHATAYVRSHRHATIPDGDALWKCHYA